MGWRLEGPGERRQSGGRQGALFEGHKGGSRTGLGDGLQVGDVTEFTTGTALSVFLSALWHQHLLRC